MGVVLRHAEPHAARGASGLCCEAGRPFVRQTHIKDAYLAHVPGGITVQARACGDGVIDFGEILALLAVHNPTLNLSLECADPREASFQPRHTLVEVFDRDWLASHPTWRSRIRRLPRNGAGLRRTHRVRGGGDLDAYVAAPFGYDESIATIRRSVAHLRRVCAERNLPLEAGA